MKKQTKHEKYNFPPSNTEHNIWRLMWERCNDKTNGRYADYGGRGICVCDRWRDFFQFVEDMGRRPSREHSIDREDNDGNYCPENCRWATRKQQALNCRPAKPRGRVFITIDGETKYLLEWSRQFGVNHETAKRRFEECGDWKKAFELAKVNREEERKLKVTIDGETRSLAGWAKKYKVPPKVVWQRINRDGMTPEEAVKKKFVPYSKRKGLGVRKNK